MTESMPDDFDTLPSAGLDTPLLGRALGMVVPTTFLCAAATGALLGAVVRYAMLEPTVGLFVDELTVGEMRPPGWGIAPILGASTTLSEVFSMLIAAGVAVLYTLFFHQLLRWWWARGQRLTFQRMEDAGVHGDRPEEERGLWRWALRRRERGALLGTTGLGALVLWAAAGEAYSAGMRTVLTALADAGAGAWDLPGGGAALADLPPIFEVLLTGGMIVAGEDGQPVIADLGALSEAVVWTASTEVLLAGLVPALALALALRTFQREGRHLLRHLIALVGPPLLAVRQRFLSAPSWAEQARIPEVGTDAGGCAEALPPGQARDGARPGMELPRDDDEVWATHQAGCAWPG
jgi:hypothetical protein